MKELIKTLPMLMALIKGEALVMYLVASMENISAILLAERGKRQVPIYFVSKTLQEAELDYPELEKLILALVYTARRFQRAGLMLVSAEGKQYTYGLIFEFETTNNEAEYEALLDVLRIAVDMKVQDLSIFVDS
ncbi:reverse transcriptase domain-containing protein [Tanacetum coccineum]